MNCTTPLSGPRKPCSNSPRYEPGRAHDQHPHERTYLPDVDQNVIDRPEHQRRHDA